MGKNDFFNSLLGFQNRDVQNLFWLIASPNIIKEHSVNNLPILPENMQKKWCDEAVSFLQKLDKEPDPLIEFLNASNSFRLGIYAEKLLHYFFENFDQTRLVLCNYQVFNKKITIGEIDFIIEWQDWLLHIELAVKYYLLDNPLHSENPHHWIGPSGKDDLGKKLNKVKNHQLELSRDVLFRKDTHLSPSPFLMLKGMFFIEADHSFQAPIWLNDGKELRFYFYWSKFKNFVEQYSSLDNFIILLRPDWMVNLYVEPNLENNNVKEFKKDWNFNLSLLEKYNSLHVYDLSKNTTYMIVKDDWPFKQ